MKTTTIAAANEAPEESDRRLQEMTRLHDLTTRISASLDLRETLDAIVDVAADLIPCALAEISLWDEQTQTLSLQAIECEPERAFPVGRSFPPGEGYTGWVVRHKRPLLVPDVAARDDVPPDLLPDERPFASYVGLPLLDDDTLIGMLVLVHDHAGAFDEKDLELLKSLANQAVAAIRNARLYEQVTHRHQELSTLYAVASVINQPLPLQEIMDQAVAKVIEVMETEAGGIRLLDEATGELVIVSSRGLSSEYIQVVDRLRVGEGIVGQVAQSGKPEVVRDLSRDSRLLPQAAAVEGYGTFAVVPLRTKEKTIGTLGVVTHQRREFTSEDLDLLTAIGHQIGVAVENARLYTDLAQRARELETVQAVAAVVNRPGDLEQILKEGLRQALAVTGLEIGAIALRDPHTDVLSLCCHEGMSPGFVAWLDGHLERKSDETWPEGQDLDIEEIPLDAAGLPTQLHEEGIRLTADVPLFAEGKLVGILSVATRKAHSFTSEETSLLQAIGHQLGTAIANAHLRQEALQAERLAAVGRVAASVAHDLRSPLGGILRSAEFLARPELSPETRDRLSEAIVSLARRLTNSTQEILDYVRGGKLPLRPAPHPLPAFLNGVLTVLEVDFSDRGIEVLRDFGYEGSVVMDTDRMAQVVYNIATNARDAMPEGGTFTVSMCEAGEHIELRFIDTGPGIPEAYRDRIFEPFFTYGKREGAGLGLAIARRIVDEHGGELWVESGEEQGATFVVALPA